MLRRPAPPAPRGRPVPPRLRARLIAAVAAAVAAAALAGGGAPAAVLQAAPRSSSAPAAPEVGAVLYVARPTLVRTRGAGNLGVDLPRGRAVVVVAATRSGVVLLAPAPEQAGLLRSLGVRRLPRYVVTRAQIAADFLPEAAWRIARQADARRLGARWPGLDAERIDRLLDGTPWVGMTIPQAEEAVGLLVFDRAPETGAPGAAVEIWSIGWRPRDAELRAWTEGREPGRRAATFDDHLKTVTRWRLRFESGVLAAMAAPALVLFLRRVPRRRRSG